MHDPGNTNLRIVVMYVVVVAGEGLRVTIECMYIL